MLIVRYKFDTIMNTMLFIIVVFYIKNFFHTILVQDQYSLQMIELFLHN